MKKRIFAALALAILLTGCATQADWTTPSLAQQLGYNDQITVIKRDGEFLFCRTDRIEGKDCNMTGRTYRGRIHTGWLDARLYIESLEDEPMNFLPYVKLDSKELYISYILAGHIIPEHITIPL